MPRESALYFVDVYVPNEGEPESALELAILRLTSLEARPTVYVHTYLQPNPVSFNRIRWGDAAEHGIKRDFFNPDRVNSYWPSISSVIAQNYLKDKDVVCFCSSLEPVHSLVSNLHYCDSILSMWQEVFAEDEEVSAISHYADMLEYLGLPRQDSSNTRYTPLMKRLFAYIALWVYLFNCKRHKRKGIQIYARNALAPNAYQNDLPPDQAELLMDEMYSGMSSQGAGVQPFFCEEVAAFWPLKDVPDPWYEGDPQSFSEISIEALQDYFSERLPDYLDWSSMFVYRHDWIFGRTRERSSRLSEQDAMLNFIFNHVFNLKTRILVLSFYAIYNQRTDYARAIALHQGSLNQLQNAIKEDFASFVITHLDDFLSANYKESIISALVDQVLAAKVERREEHLDYDQLKKYEKENNLNFYEEPISSNSNVYWYREISNHENVIYRGFLISGNAKERNECIDAINSSIPNLLNKAKNPLCEYWLSNELKQWIEYLTGFAWHELARDDRPNDSDALLVSRRAIRQIINTKKDSYYRSYFLNFYNCIKQINTAAEGEKTIFRFFFQGVEHEFIVDKTDDNLSFFGRLFTRS